MTDGLLNNLPERKRKTFDRREIAREVRDEALARLIRRSRWPRARPPRGALTERTSARYLGMQVTPFMSPQITGCIVWSDNARVYVISRWLPHNSRGSYHEHPPRGGRGGGGRGGGNRRRTCQRSWRTANTHTHSAFQRLSSVQVFKSLARPNSHFCYASSWKTACTTRW